MPFSWPTSNYNVDLSLASFFIANVNTNLPGIFTVPIAARFYNPDFPLFDEARGDYAPKFSFISLGGYDESIAQGDLLDGGQRGQKVYRVGEISCWVNGKTSVTVTNENYARDLIVMRDMVIKLFSRTRTIQILDYYASLSAPASTGYIIRIEKPVQEVEVPADPNPNVHRKRLLINYCYTQRQ